MDDTGISAFFERYQRAFELALRGDAEMGELTGLYASDFIAASPAGVTTGKNDGQFQAMMAQGYERYRAIGTKAMRLRAVRVSPVDAQHCLAHVGWRAVYAKDGRADIEIDFDVHYLVQDLGAGPRVFGWISGDEQAVLKAHGVI